MEEELKKLSNKELLQLYKLIEDHKNYLDNELEKVEKVEEK
jgi:hypothetical protein